MTLDPEPSICREEEEGSVLAEARTPSKKAYALSPSLHSTPSDGSSIQAGSILKVQCGPKQTTAVIADPQIHKKSISPLLIITNVSSLSPCGELPFEKLEPLAIQLQAWKANPDVSSWLLKTIERGYSLHFAHRPPRFRGIIHTTVKGNEAHVLRSEIQTLLEKGATEVVPLAYSESGFYSSYFLVPKKDSWLRPILDLRHLNHSLM